MIGLFCDALIFYAINNLLNYFFFICIKYSFVRGVMLVFFPFSFGDNWFYKMMMIYDSYTIFTYFTNTHKLGCLSCLEHVKSSITLSVWFRQISVNQEGVIWKSWLVSWHDDNIVALFPLRVKYSNFCYLMSIVEGT